MEGASSQDELRDFQSALSQAHVFNLLANPDGHQQTLSAVSLHPPLTLGVSDMLMVRGEISDLSLLSLSLFSAANFNWG